MKAIYTFLGSIYFAIILIVCTALFVIVGTLIESITQSHQYAALFTYTNPLFQLLLVGFFINILISALRRWPFKQHHIPFLITHLGLLMVIAGVMVKIVFGVQGNMAISEGSGRESIFLPDTYVVQVEKRDGTIAYYPLHKDLAGHYYLKPSPLFPDLDLQLAGYVPHIQTRFEGWYKHKNVLSRLAKDPHEEVRSYYAAHAELIIKNTENGTEIKTISLSENSVPYELSLEEPGLTLKFSPNEHVHIPLSGTDALQNYNLQHPRMGMLPFTVDIKMQPVILAIRDEDDNDHVYAIDQYGRVSYKKFNTHQPELLNVYDKGFGGYTLPLEIPQSLDRETGRRMALLRLAAIFAEALETGEALAPPLAELKKGCEKAGYPLPEVVVAFLEEWFRTSSWDYPEGRPLSPVLHKIFEHVEPAGMRAEEKAAEMSSQLRTYGLHLSQIPIPYDNLPTITLEAPLIPVYTPKEAAVKLEENQPKIVLVLSEQGNQEAIHLAYDRYASGLKWPVLGGRYLVRFQPAVYTLPYHIRLHDARAVSYPNSTQPYAYEADIQVVDKQTGHMLEKRLRMNAVHQTWDGYRFYLANIDPLDNSQVQRAQIVVNRDPAKYWLTYPGAFILTLGIVLLFWLKPYAKGGR